MPERMTKEQGEAFKKRWELVARREREELQAMSIDEKFRQTCALFNSVESMGWKEALAAEEEQVRQRWKGIREAYRARG